jgi:hypothetical protein
LYILDDDKENAGSSWWKDDQGDGKNVWKPARKSNALDLLRNIEIRPKRASTTFRLTMFHGFIYKASLDTIAGVQHSQPYLIAMQNAI